ncbi:bacillithiol biosynthesis deacetylase BshB1 [Aneurinibacillus thermoaerophilus]|nr:MULTISPECIES: bacillithiol biosynthesis deacetylase BshB1 [Aneurinibacillus]AMA73545.1 bacillithiol biosynthesis deacetylase BshB1 [Aneurinibacillus sp. XH2]MED0756184.1 bacillithiol biosynthesis deacetylase BshB1 [Aneurinibacillus thermoaerophilus]MED0760381.1 bacillithiol biosynthesis deacetylase BshB1 [Aneurinibacillus thermoaerophilus]SDH36477.1 bacillithiol biosynthesis deacetylase BshB1 [Aneurinibacillus thermoaerophilus]
MSGRFPAPLHALAFGAHPDDVEIGAGGLLRKWANQGKRTGICDLTKAELSSNGTVERRQQEAAEASRLLGLHVRLNLELPDRGLAPVPEQIQAITRIIRLYRPRVVLMPYWEDRHPDHGMCSVLVREAVFNARIRKYNAGGEETFPPHKVEHVIAYFINGQTDPQFLVDISKEMEAKMAALGAYRSQFEMEPGSVATPLTEGYLERVRAREYIFGQSAGVVYAEGFVSYTPLLLKDFL